MSCRRSSSSALTPALSSSGNGVARRSRSSSFLACIRFIVRRLPAISRRHGSGSWLIAASSGI
nr:MAG TPA: hypothetical protein [Caudoviricetes sp.]